MATSSEVSAIQAAINSLRGNSAYETPFAEDVALRLAPVAQSTGFMSAGAFLEAVKNNPLSTLLNWAVLLANSGGALSGSGAPTVTPDFVGQLYHDTVSDSYYRSTGTTSADWVVIGGGVTDTIVIPGTDLAAFVIVGDSTNPLTSISGPAITDITAGELVIEALDSLTTVSFPALVTTIDSINISGPALTTIHLEQVATVGGNLLLIGIPLLTSLDLSALVTVDNSLSTSNCTSLVTLDLSIWVPTDGTSLDFNTNALNAASVELILRRCVLAGVTTCTIDLSGGTNAGLASLSVQGQADAATLGGQLTINP